MKTPSSSSLWMTSTAKLEQQAKLETRPPPFKSLSFFFLFLFLLWLCFSRWALIWLTIKNPKFTTKMFIWWPHVHETPIPAGTCTARRLRPLRIWQVGNGTAVIGLLENPLQKQKGNAPNVYCMPSWLQWCEITWSRAFNRRSASAENDSALCQTRQRAPPKAWAGVWRSIAPEMNILYRRISANHGTHIWCEPHIFDKFSVSILEWRKVEVREFWQVWNGITGTSV